MKHSIQFLFVTVPLLCLQLLSGCQQPDKQPVDRILINGYFYLVDSSFATAQAIAVDKGKIVGTGTVSQIRKQYSSDDVIDLQGKYVYPGLFDAHCHFYGYGIRRQQLDLKSATSFDDMLEKVADYGLKNQEGWLVGRGWNEEEWVSKTRPNNLKLSLLFPNRPVVLQRVDGHAVLANFAALELAGIDATSKVEGGEVEVINGQLTGILVDNAADMVLDIVPPPSRIQQIKGLMLAQDDCLAAGLTAVADAGLDLDVIRLIDSLQKSGDLILRVYAMANPGETEFGFFEKNGPIKTDRLQVRSFKLYADGSLGSRGALLLERYCDDTSSRGFFLNEPEYLETSCIRAHEMGMAINSHCIGDSANRFMLDLYHRVLGNTTNQRWRIEHAQVVSPADMYKFGEYGIIPSVQPTHATSDMYMARKRLCSDERLEGAYAYKTLLEKTGMIVFGTDFPVEGISPIATYKSAVFRDRNGNVFRPEEKVDPAHAVRAMTAWAAYSCFWENELGSIEVGKAADLTILDKDLLTCKVNNTVRVEAVVIDGKLVYKR